MATFKIMDKKTGQMNDILTSNMFQSLFRYEVNNTNTSVALPSDLIPMQNKIKILIVQDSAIEFDGQTVPSRYGIIKRARIENGKLVWDFYGMKSEVPSIIILGVETNG